MIEELLKIGFGAGLGIMLMEALDKDGEIEKEIKEIEDDIRNLPTELACASEETLEDEIGGDPVKIEQSIENFKRAVNPVTRFVDQCLAMDVRQAKKNLQKGDHIFCVRDFYSHHGIYDGNGGVYHYANDDSDCGWLNTDDTMVTYCALDTFAKGDKINVRKYESKLSPEEVIARAKSKIGQGQYNVLTNNCEHYAYWCHGYYDDEKEEE